MLSLFSRFRSCFSALGRVRSCQSMARPAPTARGQSSLAALRLSRPHRLPAHLTQNDACRIGLRLKQLGSRASTFGAGRDRHRLFPAAIRRAGSGTARNGRGRTSRFNTMFYVYIIRSTKYPRHYVGTTTDVTERLQKHNNGQVRSTKAFKPWMLLKTELYTTKKEALQREHQIKRSGRIRTHLHRGPIV